MMHSQERWKWWWQLIKTKRMADHTSKNGLEVEEGVAMQREVEEFSNYFKKGFQEFRDKSKKIQEDNQIFKKCSRNPKIQILQAMMIKKKTFTHLEEEKKELELMTKWSLSVLV
ncbi:hypothetical protein Csa_023638, partial [Cucumis sativus]